MSRLAWLLALTLAGCASAPDTPGARGTPWVRKDPGRPSDRPAHLPLEPMNTQVVVETRDTCGGNCKFWRMGQSKLSLQLAEGDVAHASDEGELVERFRSVAGARSERRTWHRTWSGSWELKKTGLEVMLKPVEQQCERSDPDGDAMVQDSACALPYELKLHCELVDVPLERPLDHQTRAWACETRPRPRLEGLTSLPWIFGIRNELIVLDGGSRHEPSRRYAFEKDTTQTAVTQERSP